MVLNEKVEVKEGGIHGFSWFAKSQIKKGEWIWRLGAPDRPNTDITLTWAQIQELPADQRESFLNLAYQVDDDSFLGFEPGKEPLPDELKENHVNHSCDGNSWYESDELLVAMRTIKKGEEITYDYALTQGHPEWTLAPKCLCGKKKCRGVVTGNDWKLPELQKRYDGHFLKFIQKRIDALKPESKEGDEGEEGAGEKKEEKKKARAKPKARSSVKTRSRSTRATTGTVRKSGRERKLTPKMQAMEDKKRKRRGDDSDEEEEEEEENEEGSETEEPPKKRARRAAPKRNARKAKKEESESEEEDEEEEESGDEEAEEEESE